MIGMEAFEKCCGRWLIFPMFLSAWSCKATPKHRSLCSILGLELIRPWAASTLPKFKIDLIVVIFKKPPNRAFQLIQVLKIGPAWRRGWKNMKPKIQKEDATHGRWYWHWKDILIYIYILYIYSRIFIYILYWILIITPMCYIMTNWNMIRKWIVRQTAQRSPNPTCFTRGPCHVLLALIKELRIQTTRQKGHLLQAKGTTGREMLQRSL